MPEVEPLWVDGFEPSDEEVHKLMRSAMAESRVETNRQLLYNTILKKKQTYKEFSGLYGEKWARIYLKAKEEGRSIDNETSRKLWKEVNGVVKGKKKKQPQSDVKKEAYTQVPHRWFRDEKIVIIMGGKMELYLLLRSWIIRKKLRNDKLDIYEDYFKNGYLAASVATNKLSRDLKMSKRVILRNLDIMKKGGVIDIIKVNSRDAWDGHRHNIYIFGTVKDGKETHYIDSRVDHMI